MKTASKVYTALIFIFLYAPIIVLIIFSFNDTDTASRTQFSGFTLRWYQRLFEDRYILEALLNTLIIAVVSAFASTVLGTMAAVGINRMKRMPKKVMMNITNFPMDQPGNRHRCFHDASVRRGSQPVRRQKPRHGVAHHRAHHVLPAVCHPVRSAEAAPDEPEPLRGRAGSRLPAVRAFFKVVRRRSCPASSPA